MDVINGRKEMESLEEQFGGLKMHGETGVLLDLEQLKHKSVRQHVECPGRLQSIFTHLTSEDLLKSSQVEVVNKLTPAEKKVIQYVHDDDYIQFIDDMWPEKTRKKEVYMLDTYVNPHSKHAAYLGAGAVVQAVDKVMEKSWKNAFCIVRPPGHHSGEAKVCTGFCFFNNVAIAARYLQKEYNTERILIFDWDIHHGDGTQHIFKEDPSVLFVSLHRHDNGSFYPMSGDVTNCGTGPGKGYSVNIPWDVGFIENAQTAGTDEYIYAFERVALPIIQSFKPEFIIISAGFDSADGDPLGQCKLTYEGYAYMTRRLMDVTGGKNLIVCLEGGYNLESISWAAESVLRTLIGEKLPLEKCKTRLDLEGLKQSVKPNVVGFNAVRKCLKEYKQYWPDLEEFGNAYDNEIISRVRESYQISAGHENNFILRGEEILKKCKTEELLFYKDLIEESSQYRIQNARLREFLPKVKGFEVIKGNEYIVLENITSGRERGSIIDFKLGKSSLHETYSPEKWKMTAKKDEKSTSASLGFRLSGVILKDDISIPAEVVKKGSYITSLRKKDVIEYTRRLFASNQGKFEDVNPVPLKGFIEYLQNLLHFFEEENTRSFVSTSIIAIVDNISNSYAFRLIDFNYIQDLPVEGQRDGNVIMGIKSLLDISKRILETHLHGVKKKQ